MRVVLWVVIAVVVIWSGYWVVVSQGLERSGKAWFADRQSDGWVADYDSLDTRGFPYRFDTKIKNMTLADPRSGVVWTAPEFEIAALAYQPNHIIALFPPAQTLRSPLETITITNDDMRASLRLQAGTSLALDTMTAELAKVAIQSDQGWQAMMEKALAAIRLAEGETTSYDIYFDAGTLRPNDALRLGIDPKGRLPDTFEALTLEATTQFDAPWDRFAIEKARPQPRLIDLKNFNAQWGKLELRAVGTLTIDATGTPEGQITVKATNWREIVILGEATGMIPEAFLPSLTRVLEVLAGMSGPAHTIDTPLTFRNGRISLGPIPLGRAPKLRLR